MQLSCISILALAPAWLAAQQLTEAPALAAPHTLTWETAAERGGGDWTGPSPLLRFGLSRRIELRMTSEDLHDPGAGLKIAIHERAAVIVMSAAAALAWSAPLPSRFELQSNCIFAKRGEKAQSVAVLRPVAGGWTAFAEIYQSAGWAANAGAVRDLGGGKQLEFGTGRGPEGRWFARVKFALEIRP